MEKHQLYNGSVELVFDPAKHLYTVEGKKVDGVTGILGVIGKGFLVPWAAKMTADAMRTLLKPGVAYTDIQIEQMCEEAKGAHKKKSANAADIGHLVHSWIENYIADGGKEKELPANQEAKNAVTKFLQWVSENHVEFILSEKKVYSREYNFAGTLDFTAKVNGKLVLGDIKTSNGIYDDMFFQCSAYQKARQEEHPEEKYEEQLIVNCRKDGTLETRSSTDFEKNWKAFAAAHTLFHRQNEMKQEDWERKQKEGNYGSKST